MSELVPCCICCFPVTIEQKFNKGETHFFPPKKVNILRKICSYPIIPSNSLLQLDVNLIEGEPYNRLAP